VHLASARSVRCTPDQVIVLSSAQEALELACRVLIDPGDAAWLEDPTWSGARAALLSAGARVVPVPVDGEGLDVGRGVVAGPDARVAYVTPSHQFPMGVTLSLERRRALLRWAATQRAWILEDDYDSEFRYTGRPLPALQGLDPDGGRVLYVGTFNKTVFPALRLGYLVVPPDLVEPFRALRGVGGQHAPTLDQAVLTDFIAEGHYARHLRRMGTICRARRDALIEAARREAPGLIEIEPAETGLHTIGWLPAGVDDRQAAAAAFDRGVEAAPLSNYCLGDCPRPGLVLGYSGCRPEEIGAGMARLATALRGVR
jgi:GntR family transcriptional regulator / MocR family aminotransferase